MGDAVITVRDLGKRYRLGERSIRYRTLRDAIAGLARPKPKSSNDSGYIWALRGVSLDVERGEVLGVIGKNGAGKTTLLKILSRITEPTEGEARIKGRVGSLLEVGTGFHQELTGRENIYLNGAILGMTKREIDAKFDEIVEFSEMGKFIETPVKFYSSGMQVRLAFAVAAHLEPDILILDEILAVGDAAFQRKCLGKMDNVASEGRTILFVSHNMAAVKKLCTRAILLDGGRVRISGGVDDVVGEYERSCVTTTENRSGVFPLVNHAYGIFLDDVKADVVSGREHASLRIELKLRSIEKIRNLGVGITVYTHDGFPVARLSPQLTANIIPEVSGACSCVLEARDVERYLASGEYYLSVYLRKPRENILAAENIARFSVPVFDVYGSGVPFSNASDGITPIPLRIIDIK